MSVILLDSHTQMSYCSIRRRIGDERTMDGGRRGESYEVRRLENVVAVGS